MKVKIVAVEHVGETVLVTCSDRESLLHLMGMMCRSAVGGACCGDGGGIILGCLGVAEAVLLTMQK